MPCFMFMYNILFCIYFPPWSCNFNLTLTVHDSRFLPVSCIFLRTKKHLPRWRSTCANIRCCGTLLWGISLLRFSKLCGLFWQLPHMRDAYPLMGTTIHFITSKSAYALMTAGVPMIGTWLFLYDRLYRHSRPFPRVHYFLIVFFSA